jgi:hypothetical protein
MCYGSRLPKRAIVGSIDRLVFVGLYRSSSKVVDALKILQPKTVIRWGALVSAHIGAGNQDSAEDPRGQFARSFSRLVSPSAAGTTTNSQ